VPGASVESSLTAAFDRAEERVGLSHPESVMLLVLA
jgi:hypothetical protein